MSSSIAYVVSQYPARSHTFIRREIEELRRRGQVIHCFSLRKMSTKDILSREDADSQAETWSVFPLDFMKIFLAHLGCIFSNPLRYFSTLSRSIEMKGLGAGGAIYSIIHFVECVSMLTEMKKRKVTLVHAHFSNAGGKIGCLAAHYLNVPYVISLHGAYDFGFPASIWLEKLLDSAEAVRCVSFYGASQIMRVIPQKDHSKIFVAYSGINVSATDVVYAKPHIPESPLCISCVGRLAIEKNQQLVIQAAKVLKKNKVNVVVELVGDGPDKALLEKLCRQLGVEDNVVFHGAVEESAVYDFIGRADIFLCTSLMEGLPQVLMESMIVGTPVVAPYLAGIPELVEQRKTGLLYPASSLEILVDTIMTLYNDEELYQDLVENGRRKVQTEFLITSTISPLHEKLQTLRK